MQVNDRPSAPPRDAEHLAQADSRKIVKDERGQDQPKNKSSAQEMGAPTTRAGKKEPAKKVSNRPGPPR